MYGKPSDKKETVFTFEISSSQGFQNWFFFFFWCSIGGAMNYLGILELSDVVRYLPENT